MLSSNNGHGPLHSAVPGRTDHLPLTVRSDSHVIPADIVSALGEGNTNAGMKIMAHMFPRSMHPDYAKGGNVPINAAGGEFVVVPEDVKHHGGGDLKRGHDVLDHFIKATRAKTIKTLRKLPGPSK